MIPGPYRCGCNPTYGQSCRYCDGVDAEDAELRRADTSRYRQQVIADREKTNPATEDE